MGLMKPGDFEQKDVRVTFILKGEEAIEFIRFSRRQNIKPGLAGRILVVEGLKSKGFLPKWWRASKN